jgi:hypothetical protein
LRERVPLLPRHRPHAERARNALRGVSLAKGIAFRGIGRRRAHGRDDRATVVADKTIPTRLDCLGLLGFITHRHARHAQEKCPFLHTARVGRDTMGYLNQRQEVLLPQWLD